MSEATIKGAWSTSKKGKRTDPMGQNVSVETMFAADGVEPASLRGFLDTLGGHGVEIVEAEDFFSDGKAPEGKEGEGS